MTTSAAPLAVQHGDFSHSEAIVCEECPDYPDYPEVIRKFWARTPDLRVVMGRPQVGGGGR